MASPFLNDTFTDTAGAALESHAGEVGAAWTRSSFTGFTAESQITATGTARPSAANLSVYLASGAAASADYDLTATLAVKTLQSGGCAGVVGRAVAGTSPNFYGGIYQHGTGYYLFKQVNGANTQLGTPAAVTAADGDVLTLQFRGTTLNLLVNGSLVASATDTSFSAPGAVGTLLYAPVAPTDSTGVQLSSISGSTAPALAAGAIAASVGTPASSTISITAPVVPSGGTAPYTTRLERSFDNALTWHAVDNFGALPYLDTGLPRSTTVVYRAIVTDSAGAAGVTLVVSSATSAAAGAPTALVVCGIDSITHGFGASTDQNISDTSVGLTTGSNYPARLTALLGDHWDVRNVGVNGQSLTTAFFTNREAAFFNAATYPAAQVLVLFGGINDLRNGASPATAYASLKAYTTARQAAGWRIVVCTLHDVIDPASSFTTAVKDSFNSLIRAGWQYDLQADALADIGADNRIGLDGAAGRSGYANYYTTLDVPKHEHLNDRGYEILADVVAAAVSQACGYAGSAPVSALSGLAGHAGFFGF